MVPWKSDGVCGGFLLAPATAPLNIKTSSTRTYFDYLKVCVRMILRSLLLTKITKLVVQRIENDIPEVWLFSVSRTDNGNRLIHVCSDYDIGQADVLFWFHDAGLRLTTLLPNTSGVDQSKSTDASGLRSCSLLFTWSMWLHQRKTARPPQLLLEDKTTGFLERQES